MYFMYQLHKNTSYMCVFVRVNTNECTIKFITSKQAYMQAY